MSAGKKQHGESGNRYDRIIEAVFHRNYKPGTERVCFVREDLTRAAEKLDIDPPKNLGDLVSNFRFRNPLPASVRAKAPKGREWVIRLDGKGRYCFCVVRKATIDANELMATVKVPDSTPGLIAMYAFTDEQALLAKLRYNRLIDIFTGVTCHSLQNHLRTTVDGLGQVETDEVYVGIDRRGAHYVLPVQAKRGADWLSIVQIEQDFAVCAAKFPSLVCKPIAAQFMDDAVIALFDFENTKAGVRVSSEKHYRLVPPRDMTDADLATYRKSLS